MRWLSCNTYRQFFNKFRIISAYNVYCDLYRTVVALIHVAFDIW